MKFQRDNLFSRTDTVAAGDLALVVALKGAQSSPLPVTTSTTGAATGTTTRVAASATPKGWPASSMKVRARSSTAKAACPSFR